MSTDQQTFQKGAVRGERKETTSRHEKVSKVIIRSDSKIGYFKDNCMYRFAAMLCGLPEIKCSQSERLRRRNCKRRTISEIQQDKCAFLSGTFLNIYKGQYPPYLSNNMLFTG